MTTTAPDDFDERMRLELKAQRRVAAEAWLRKHMDETFDVPGDMRPEVTAWFSKMVDPQQKAGNLVMCGPLGVGKSWHLWRIFADLVRHHDGHGKVALVTAYNFKKIVAPPVDYDQLDRFAQAGLFLLDDVGSVRLSDWDLDILFGVVDQRWSGRRPTGISSNTLDLRSLLGERIASRLAERVTVVELTGIDRRRAVR